MTQQIEVIHQDGDIIDVPLNKLKKSPRNARRTPHAEADIEALAASIAAKGVLQAPVVEPETDADGAPTGAYLVTIGEGRRLALRLLAQRKRIKKTEPVRCVVDLSNDPHEISLDENVTRAGMHPADQFEAFRRLSDERGLSAEEIGARFGVSAQVVRQRLRLGAVNPGLMALYRAGELNLDQMMAFAVSEDHARQAQALEQLGSHRPPYLIRRAMTEAKVSATDRRAIFVGAEAYGEAGGTILRDLFTEDGGGWFEDPALLDRLVAEKLAGIAEDVRQRESWKWAEAHIDYPRALGLGRVYPHPVERPEDEAASMAALSEEYDALVSQWDAVEELPPEIAARFAEIDAALEAFGDGTAFDPEEIARGGVFVILGQDGVARIERGLIRPEDVPTPEPDPESEDAGGSVTHGAPTEEDATDEADEDAGAPWSERLVLDLTAQRTLALRDALGASPTVALSAVVHSLALFAFYPPYDRASCLEIKGVTAYLDGHAPGIDDTRAGRSIAERHERWAVRLPKSAADLWAFVQGLAATDLLDLLAHCASLTVNAVRTPFDRKPAAWAHADRLAEAVGLDMTGYWTPTVTSYLGRVTKARITEAVREAVSDEAAERISGLKKPDMASEAEALLVGKGWLPSLLRAPIPVELEVHAEAPVLTEQAA
ncbi:MAG: ParB/Srx family N-terminal domain-containing protein [Phenylobacterium sp.]|uniref:ParB/RepB/Spo0J family partition protein n=1 Tax=Phenylobacterium sp. TaxID=1871053 RepID=UPI0027367D37|nr:ParB/Srx family N-terminal domain-containing protein [Phenylobacterium sp.]MDP3115943.1 ParB/Srx family N-terminal domain-containing protein [Phenylobacterium sp.]